MKVIDVVEQDDGSAIVTVDMTKEEQDFFMEKGFISALKEGMKFMEKDLCKSCDLCDDPTCEGYGCNPVGLETPSDPELL